MPIKRNRPEGSATPQPPANDVSTIRKWLAGAARVGGGLIGTEGGPPGGIAASAGELVAEALEGSLGKTTPARLGVEYALGNIPFSRAVRLGKAGASMVRSGAFSGAGDVGRQWAEGNFDEQFEPGPEGKGWNYGRTAVATGLGGLTGGVLGHFLHAPKAPPKVEPIIENMGGGVPKTKSRPGASVGAGTRTTSATGAPMRGYEPQYGTSVPPPTGGSSRAIPYGVADASDEAGLLADLESQFGRAMNKSDVNFDYRQVQRGKENALDTQFQDAIRAKNASMDANEAARREIETTKLGLDKQPPTVTETVKAPGQTQTTRYKAPTADDEGGVEALNQLLTGKSPQAAQEVTQAIARSSPRVQQLLQNLDDDGIKVFNYYVNKEGLGDLAAYRKAYYDQGVRRARISRTLPPPQVGPKASPPDQLRATTHPSFYDDGFDGLDDVAPKVVPPKGGPPPAAAAKLAADIEAANASGQKDIAEQLPNLSRIFNDPASSPTARKEAGKQLRELSKFLRPKAEGAAGAAPAAPDWVAEQTAAVDKLSKSRGKGTTLGAGLGGAQDIFEIARQNPEFATSAVTTILGGAIGGMMDDEGTSLDGILGGAAAGLGIGLAPRLAAAIGRDASDLADAGKIRQMAVEIASKLPQVQRASLLTSTNLPANAFFGPWGSVVTKLIEDILKGNHQQALPALKEAWNPVEFGRNMIRLRGKARDRLIHGELGRDAIDDRLVQQGGNLSRFDEALIFPGWVMTAGDEAAYALLSKYGYGEDEIRKAVLTSEPTSKLGRNIANFGKGSFLGNLMLPFKRTPANIMEQGAQRLPFVGPAISKKMGRNVSGREALVEQGMSLGAGVGAGTIAANIDDPMDRRNWRAYVTNPAGVYSLAANLGWITGDAIASNKDPDSVLTDPFTYEQLTPLPTTDPMMQFGKVARNVIRGDVDQVSDVVPRSLSFEQLRKMMSTSAEAFGADELASTVYSPPRQRGLRRVRGPRRNQ